MLDPGEPLFLGRGDDPAVEHQCGSAVVIERGNPQNRDHFAPSAVSVACLDILRARPGNHDTQDHSMVSTPPLMALTGPIPGESTSERVIERQRLRFEVERSRELGSFQSVLQRRPVSSFSRNAVMIVCN